MSKLSSKLRNIINAVPKHTAAILLMIVAVLVPVAIFAAGSTRTENLHVANPAQYITFNQYVDNAIWGDEHDFVRIGPADKAIESMKIGDFKNALVAEEGKEYYVYMYVHNNAASWLNLEATNVRARIGKVDNAAGTTQQLRGFITADNCGADNKGNVGSACAFWDEATFQSVDGRKFTMEYVVGSAVYKNNHGTFQLPDSTVTGGNPGVLVGEKSMNGKILGCADHSGNVVVRVKPKYEPKQTPSYDVEKKVNGTTHNVAKPGETMTYTITAKNTGNVELTNVKINDTLPAYYSNVKETINSPAGHTGSIVNGGSVNLTKLPVGATATITISYTIKGESAFECGKTTNFINKVTSTSDQDKTEDRTDNNEVNTDITYPCEPVKVPNFDLEKTVDKTTANIGDTLSYKLTFRNTGETDLTNVVIKDTLPAGLTYVSGSIKVEGATTHVGDLFNGGIVIPRVAVNGVVTITFRAKVNNNAVVAENCGDTTKNFVNKSSSTTNEKADESNKNNNDTTTTVTVNKKCDPSYDVIKTVDKTVAKPGETLIYTILVKNTGNIDLTNVVVKDILPNYLASAKANTTAQSTVSGDLFKEGITITKLHVGETVTIKVEAVVKSADQLPCGATILNNRVESSNDQNKNEDHLNNNDADTTVDKECTPPPEIPQTPETPTVPPTKPEYIVATGPVEAIAATIGTGALTFGVVAYMRSRKDLMRKLRK